MIGDIRDSRNLRSRKNAQERLKEILDEINEKYSSEIASKFLITLGDEFQGLLFPRKNVLAMIQEIRSKLYPVEIRIGIGIGTIITEIDTEMALGADGPGYYNARNAIELLKGNEKRNKKVDSDIYIAAEDKKQVMLINTIFELIRVIEQDWTDRQRELIWDMMQYRDTQQSVATRKGTTQSAVNKALVKGNYYVYEKALRNVSEMLGDFYLQTPKMAELKKEKITWVLAHALIYGACALALLRILVPGLPWGYGKAFAMAHLIIDLVKYVICARFIKLKKCSAKRTYSICHCHRNMDITLRKRRK